MITDLKRNNPLLLIIALVVLALVMWALNRDVRISDDAGSKEEDKEHESVRNFKPCARGHFPSDEAATKLLWLVLRNISEGWKNPPIVWHAAKTQLAFHFEERFIVNS